MEPSEPPKANAMCHIAVCVQSILIYALASWAHWLSGEEIHEDKHTYYVAAS